MRQPIQVIQIIRLFSAIIVLLSHFFPVDEYALPRGMIFVGRTGVAFFFIISGFLLVYTDRNVRKHYFLKRLIRLAPLYWATTLLVFCIGIVSPGLLHTSSASVINLLKSVCFIPFYTNDDVLPLYPIGWTLTVEVFVYVVYFIPMQILQHPTMAEKFKGNERIFNASVTSAILVCIVILKLLVPRNLFTDTYGRYYMLYFVEGLLFGILWDKTRSVMEGVREKLKTKLKSAGWIISLMIGTALILYSAIYDENLLGILLMGISFALLVLFLGSCTFPSILVKFGNMTYSFYLLHYFVVKLFLRLLTTENAVTNIPLAIVECVVCCAVTMGLSAVSYYLVEQKLTKWLKQICKI